MWAYKNKGKSDTYALYKISYKTNRPPFISSATATSGTVKNAGNAPLTTTFIGHAKDYDDYNLKYEWHFGDGAKASGQMATHTYTANGEFFAVLYVSDHKSTVSSEPIKIMVGIYPDVVIQQSASTFFAAGDTIKLADMGTYHCTMEKWRKNLIELRTVDLGDWIPARRSCSPTWPDPTRWQHCLQRPKQWPRLQRQHGPRIYPYRAEPV